MRDPIAPHGKTRVLIRYGLTWCWWNEYPTESAAKSALPRVLAESKADECKAVDNSVVIAAGKLAFLT